MATSDIHSFTGLLTPGLAAFVTAGAAALAQGPAALVRDIHTAATTATVSSNPRSFVTFGGATLFFASTPATGTDLWRSDGTSAGTWMVSDLPDNAAQPDLLTAAGGFVFFVATDALHGEELWRSDGTHAGTFMVKDISTGGSSRPRELLELNGILYFRAENFIGSPELWRSDGTTAGTWQVADLYPGLFGAAPQSLVVMGGRLYFHALTPGTGR